MDEDARTLWCGNLSDKVTEELLYELFLQAAPLERVRIPTDKNGRKSNYGFVTVKHEVSADYVVQLLHGTNLFERRITVKRRNSNQNQPQLNMVNVNSLFVMGQMLQPLSPIHHQHFQNERPHNKPYDRGGRYDNHSRHNRNNFRNNYGNERNRRRYY